MSVHGGRVFQTAARLGVSPEEVIDFSASINPLGLSPAVAGAIARAIPHIVHYPEEHAESLRRTLAELHGIDPAEVAAANGTTQLIHLLPRVLAGRSALLVAPCFGEYLSALEKGGWRASFFHLRPEEEFCLGLRLLARELEGKDLLFLCNPGNPAGNLLSPAALEEILLFCRESGTTAVIDEAFIDFSPGASLLESPSRHGAVVLRSLTKFHTIPGLRLGYAVADAPLASLLREGMEPWSVNTLAAAAGAAAVADREHAAATLVYMERERERLAQGLSALSLRVFPSSANFLLAELPEGSTAGELQEELLASRILIRDCSDFPGLSPRFFRVAVRTAEENALLLSSLSTLLR